MTGKKTYKERDTENKRGKKRYLEREIQDKESKKEVEEFFDEEGHKIPREWLNYGGTD
jgi:hypothetical protein